MCIVEISGLEKCSLVKTTCCYCRGPGFSYRHPRSQPSGTSVPGDTTPSFQVHEHQAHMVQHINTGKSLINKPKDVISRACEYLRENHSSFFTVEVEDFILQEEGFFP